MTLVGTLREQEDLQYHQMDPKEKEEMVRDENKLQWLSKDHRLMKGKY